MEPRAVRELASHLASEEKLIWAGSPDPWRYALFRLAPSWAWIVFIGAIKIAWTLIVVIFIGQWMELSLAWHLATIAAVPVILLALYVANGPVRRFLEARHMTYGLTDRRAVILVAGKRSRIEEIFPARFLDPETRRHGNGTLTVLFFEDSRVARGLKRGFIGVRDGEALVGALERHASKGD